MTWTGYKLHLTETCGEGETHLITRAQTTQAHVSDVSQTQKVHDDLAWRRLLPAEHLADAGFVDTKPRRMANTSMTEEVLAYY